MTVYNLYIFDGQCKCLFYREWVRRKQAGISQEEEFKLMYGMIYSLKSLVSRLSPSSSKESFHSYSTDKYKLHLYETLTGVKFVLNTDNRVGDLQELLHHVHSKIYVEYVVKNPRYQPGDWITSELFASQLDACMQAKPFFK